MSKEQKITGNIQLPNKDLEILKQNFPNCFDKNGEFDFKKFKIQLSKNEINFSKESYGMDWLGKSYARLLATDETTTLLKEDETFNQKEENENSENLLINGDNLEVLKHHCMISPMKTTKPNTFRYIHLCSFYSFSLLFCCLACK